MPNAAAHRSVCPDIGSAIVLADLNLMCFGGF
jgi:hypothetical protein